MRSAAWLLAGVLLVAGVYVWANVLGWGVVAACIVLTLGALGAAKYPRVK